MFISTVIAAYNERGNVEPLFLRIMEVLKKINVDFEIVGIIDGNDGAYEALEKIKKEKNIKNWRLYHSRVPSGLGNAYKKGFNLVTPKASHVLTMDADWNHDPEEIPKLIARMKHAKADIVIGSRYCGGGKMEGVPVWKRFLSETMNLFFDIITKVKAKDKTSSYRLYTKRANDVIKTRYTSKNFEYAPEVLIIAQKNGLKVAETPIHFKYRTVGKSKMKIVATTKGYIRLIAKTMFGK